MDYIHKEGLIKKLLIVFLFSFIFTAPYPSITYTFTPKTLAISSYVNKNFADIVSAFTDGSKRYNAYELYINNVLGIDYLRNAYLRNVSISDGLAVSGNIFAGGSNDKLYLPSQAYFDKNGLSTRMNIPATENFYITGPMIGTALFITQDGKIGINMTDPKASLHINGSLYVDNVISTNYLNVNSATLNNSVIRGGTISVNSLISGTVTVSNSIITQATISQASINILNVSTITNNGDITISANGRVKLGATFGAWTNSGYQDNTVYQATTDLFVCAFGYMTTDGGAITGYTDSNSSPTEVVQQVSVTSAGDKFGSICFPVKKGDYWKVIATDSVTIKTLAFGI